MEKWDFHVGYYLVAHGVLTCEPPSISNEPICYSRTPMGSELTKLLADNALWATVKGEMQHLLAGYPSISITPHDILIRLRGLTRQRAAENR